MLRHRLDTEGEHLISPKEISQMELKEKARFNRIRQKKMQDDTFNEKLVDEMKLSNFMI